MADSVTLATPPATTWRWLDLGGSEPLALLPAANVDYQLLWGRQAAGTHRVVPFRLEDNCLSESAREYLCAAPGLTQLQLTGAVDATLTLTPRADEQHVAVMVVTIAAQAPAARVLVDVTDLGEAATVWLVVQGEVAADTRLELVLLGSLGRGRRLLISNGLTLAAGARLELTEIIAGRPGSTIVTDHAVTLAGAGATLEAQTASWLRGATARFNYNFTHRAARTHSQLASVAILERRARKQWQATTDFATGSRGAVGREQETVFLFGEELDNRSLPVILSGEADVDGQHGVTSGRVSPEVLEYWTARGSDARQARQLFGVSQMRRAVARVGNQQLENRLYMIFDQIGKKV